MKTSSAKAKGRRLSQAVKSAICAVFPSLLPDQDVICTPSGVNGPDIILSQAALKILPFSIECKNQERVNIWEAWAQAKRHVLNFDSFPVVVISRNREPEPLTVITLKHFLELCAQRKSESSPEVKQAV